MRTGSKGFLDMISQLNDEYKRQLEGQQGRRSAVLNTPPKRKVKNFYHTFEYEEREITLLLNVEEDFAPFGGESSTATMKVTYAVRLLEDKEIEGLTKKILFGRLAKNKVLGTFTSGRRFGYKLAYLKGIAHCIENEIRTGVTEIAGVTNGIRKDKSKTKTNVEKVQKN
jgi:predicted transcriptional regulator